MWLVGPANDRMFNSSDKMVANNFTGDFSDEGQIASSPISRLDIWNNDNNSSMDFLETVQLLMPTGQGETLENSTVLDTPDLEQTYATTHLQVGLDISSTKSSYMSTSPCEVFLSFAIFNDTSLPIVCNNRTNITSSDYEGYISATDQENNWFILMLLPLVIFGAAGNLLVCLAISMEKRLQNITNYFLLSLAVTDLLVSIIVMPLSIIHEFHGYWPLGLGLCDFFVTSDVLMCTSSIMHLCTISLERYLAIRFPLRTRNKSKQIVILKIGLVWAISIAISSPITVLGFVNPINILSNRHCVLTNDHFVIYGSILAFFIPLVIMIIMYTLTIHILYKQSHMCGSKNGRKGSHPLVRRSTSNRYRNKEAATRSKSLPVTRKSMEKRGHRAQHCGREENGKFRAIFRKSQSSLDKPLSHTSETVPLKIENAHDSPQFEDSTTTTPEISSQGQEDEPPRLLLLLKKHNLAIRAANLLLLKKDELPRANNVQTEQRASKVLGIVFAIFVVCWAPFFCVNIMTALCKSCSFDPTLITVFVWLGYVSSTLNPIIYTVFNRVFKVTFWKLLCCRYNQLGRSRSPNKRKTTLKSKYHSVRCQPSFGFSANDTQTLHTQNDTVF